MIAKDIYQKGAPVFILIVQILQLATLPLVRDRRATATRHLGKRHKAKRQKAKRQKAKKGQKTNGKKRQKAKIDKKANIMWQIFYFTLNIM